jgi:hypothetical protein
MATRNVRLSLAFGLMLGLLLPACRGPETRPGQTYSAYKPKPEAQPKRTLFLGGYAGYNYGPIGERTTLPTNEGGDLYGRPITRKSAELSDQIW